MRDANGVIDPELILPVAGTTGDWWSYELVTSRELISTRKGYADIAAKCVRPAVPAGPDCET